MAQGDVVVREKPGPKNSLGLVKFMFPNQYDIYLHSTPAPYRCSIARGATSAMAAFACRSRPIWRCGCWTGSGQGQAAWDLEKVQEAIDDESQNNRTVRLEDAAADCDLLCDGEVEDDGEVHFFDDIYGYDADHAAGAGQGAAVSGEAGAGEGAGCG